MESRHPYTTAVVPFSYNKKEKLVIYLRWMFGNNKLLWLLDIWMCPWLLILPLQESLFLLPLFSSARIAFKFFDSCNNSQWKCMVVLKKGLVITFQRSHNSQEPSLPIWKLQTTRSTDFRIFRMIHSPPWYISSASCSLKFHLMLLPRLWCLISISPLERGNPLSLCNSFLKLLPSYEVHSYGAGSELH